MSLGEEERLAMATILDKIFADKKEELDGTKRKAPLAQIKGRISEQQEVRKVRQALEQSPPSRIIAEIKKRTPFKGELRSGFDALEIARLYEKHGAAAISVLTETRYFGGNLDILSQIREQADLPLLRKDFIFDEYQVYESRAFGADFFLLIATWLDKNHLADLMALGRELGLRALVETHCEADMEKAFSVEASIIGINNRDLTTGRTDLNISRRLIPMGKMVPGNVLVCESGIHGPGEIGEFEGLGAHAFLIGESLVTAENIPEKLTELVGKRKEVSSRRD